MQKNYDRFHLHQCAIDRGQSYHQPSDAMGYLYIYHFAEVYGDEPDKPRG